MDSLLSIFKSHAGKFKSSLADVRAKSSRAKQRREDLRTLPLPPEEVVEVMCGVLSARAAAYEQTMRNRVMHALADPNVTSDSPGIAQTAYLVNGYGVSGAEVEGMIAYFCRDQLRTQMQKIAGQDAGRKHGPPRAEREAELQALEVEIADLELREKEMVAELDAIRKETST